MSTDILAGLSPTEREVVEQGSYKDAHTLAVQHAPSGKWNILRFFDALPWLRGGADWTPWRAFLAALFGLPMTPAELAIYRECTGRQQAPTKPASEAWMPVGRRGRKSAIMAVVAAYVGAYRDHSLYLAPNERARIPVLSKTKEDAQQIKRYVDGIFDTPALSWLVEDSGAEVVRLSTRVDIVIRAAVITAGRGPASPLAILDEVAFFRTDDSAHPDKEIVTGIRGSFANVPGAILIAASSPYARKGMLYERHRDYHGKEGSSVLVWQAPTLAMHNTPDIQAFVAEETTKDPVGAKAEYGAEFRTDIEIFITEELLLAVTDAGIIERPPLPGIQYVAFTDPSGGTSDSFTLAIGHWEQDRVVLDYLDEAPAPFKPGQVTQRFCRVLARYGVSVVEGDAYAGEWPREQFDIGFCEHEGDPCKKNANGVCALRYGVAYVVSENPKRVLYRDALPILTNERPRLLDSPRLRKQMTDLERRPGIAGDRIDHPEGEHDDVANAVAGVLVRAARMKLKPRIVQPAPTNPVEAHQRKLHDTLKARIKQYQRDKDGGNGQGGWI